MQTTELATILPTVKPHTWYPNYKKLALALGVPALDGAAKVAQLQNLSRYMELYKDDKGNGYKVGEVYDEVRPVESRDTTGVVKGRAVMLLERLVSLASIYQTNHPP